MEREDMDVQSNLIYTASVTQRTEERREEKRGKGREEKQRGGQQGEGPGSSHLSADCAGRVSLNCPTGWTACRGNSGQEALEA